MKIEKMLFLLGILCLLFVSCKDNDSDDSVTSFDQSVYEAGVNSALSVLGLSKNYTEMYSAEGDISATQREYFILYSNNVAAFVMVDPKSSAPLLGFSGTYSTDLDANYKKQGYTFWFYATKYWDGESSPSKSTFNLPIAVSGNKITKW